MAGSTRWSLVALVTGAGLLAACQVGKAAVALPAIRRDLGLSLAEASWIVSAYAALGACAGLAAGTLVARIGARAAMLAGLAAIALGSTGGAFAGSIAPLLASRVVEGCGFLALAIAGPSIIGRLTAIRDRDLSLALWGTYMPAGTAVMMLAGPALLRGGWPALWLVNAALALAYAALVAALVPTDERHPRAAVGAAVLPEMGRVLASRGPVLLALAFGTYTAQYFALTALMPTLLHERLGLSIAAAGTLSAAVVVANAAGNLLAGALMRRGVPLWLTAGAGFAAVGLIAPGVFIDLPVALVAALAAASLAISGVIPASLFAGAPRLAPAPQLVPITLGLMMQASNVGQLVGPVALGAMVERFGWASAPALFAAVALAGLAVAAALRRRIR